MRSEYLTETYELIAQVQAKIESSLPKDLIRKDLAKTIKTLKELAIVADENHTPKMECPKRI